MIALHGSVPPDTSNRFEVVGTKDGNLCAIKPPLPREVLTREKALNLAAWLVAIADDDHAEAHTHQTFAKMLQAIETSPGGDEKKKRKT